jgi:ribosome-associated translation inhibitor RaiA
MSTQLDISFHGLERSDAVESRIREKFDRLHQYFDRISYGRVVVETPRKHSPTVKVFQVKIEIGVPGQKPLVVCQEPSPERERTDVLLAVRDAFAAARRQLTDTANQIKHPAKRERARRRPAREVVEPEA